MYASLAVYFLLTSNLMVSEFWRVKNTCARNKGGSSSENALCKDNTRPFAEHECSLDVDESFSEEQITLDTPLSH